ncbi:MAG: nuclear transport factor 2 family protein [Verrucomicrobia bacterium]|nr:nuclear transport factor 2 family protein [Verrucomicrobiota bacterium]
MSPSAEPEVVVQRQLDAYNGRNLGELLAVYAPDASLWEHPNRLVAQGADALRERFAARFAEPNLHAHLRQRMVMGNFVVDHETVTRTFPEGPGTLELIMLYEVRDGRIAQAWSLIGPKRLDL